MRRLAPNKQTILNICMKKFGANEVFFNKMTAMRTKIIFSTETQFSKLRSTGLNHYIQKKAFFTDPNCASVI